MKRPWDILGVDPKTVDLRGLKRAYARAVKEHRPDRDPDGFREVHEAYERLRNMIEMRERFGAESFSLFADTDGTMAIRFGSGDEDSEDDQVDAPGTDASDPAGAADPDDAGFDDELEDDWSSAPGPLPPPSSEADRAVSVAIDRLEDAACPDDRVDRAVADAVEAWRSGRVNTHFWNRFIDAMFQRDESLPGRTFTLEDALLEIERQSARLTTPVMLAAVRRDEWEDLERFAERLIARAHLLSERSAPFALAECARMFALADGKLARQLADLSFQTLPIGMRDVTLVGLDLALEAGSEMTGLPKTIRRRIAAAVFEGSVASGDHHSRDALRALARMRKVPVAKKYVFAQFPKLKREFSRDLARSRGKEYTRASGTGWSGGRGSGGSYLLIFLLLTVVRALSCNSSRERYRVPRPPVVATNRTPRSTREMLRQLGIEDEEVLARIQREQELRELTSHGSRTLYLTEKHLPGMYDAYEWLKPTRVRISTHGPLALRQIRRMCDGGGEIPRHGERYDTMVRVFASDRSLPEDARRYAIELRDRLGLEPLADADPPDDSDPSPGDESPPEVHDGITPVITLPVDGR